MTTETEYVLAPMVATEAMLDAGVAMALQVSVDCAGGWTRYIGALYAQLLSAAPPPPPRVVTDGDVERAHAVYVATMNREHRHAIALRAALESFAASGEVSGWRPIETIPHDLDSLGCKWTSPVMLGCWDEYGWIEWIGQFDSGMQLERESERTFRDDGRRASHWHPLPPPPAKEGER